jgi:hypothetical protein
LFADSAVTSNTLAAQTHVSSFGEVSVCAEGVVVEEGALKIVRIGTDCAIALAGSVRRAIDSIESLRGAYDPTTTIPNLLRQLGRSIDASVDNGFTFLIARCGHFGAELWHWTSATPMLCNEVTVVHEIGSLPTWHVHLTRYLASFLTQRNLDESRLSSVITAMLQSYGIHDAMHQHGVGARSMASVFRQKGLNGFPTPTT